MSLERFRPTGGFRLTWRRVLARDPDLADAVPANVSAVYAQSNHPHTPDVQHAVEYQHRVRVGQLDYLLGGYLLYEFNRYGMNRDEPAAGLELGITWRP